MSVDKKKIHEYAWNSFHADSEGAFRFIYSEYAESLYTFGRKFGMEEEQVEDAVQEVFVDLYLKSQDITSSIINLKAYLFVALKNNLLKKLASQKRFPTSPLDIYRDLEFNITYDPQEYLIRRELGNEANLRLTEAVNALSKKQKEIIYLKFEEELDYPDIAKILQISIESARKQIYRALKSLRETLNDEELSLMLCIFTKKS